MASYKRGHNTKGTIHPSINLQNLCWTVAFDPGETTGYTVMGCHPSALDQRYKDEGNILPLEKRLLYIDYGQIDCVGGGFEDTTHKHAGISFGAEAVGVSRMMDIIWKLPDPAIVVEDFIVDFNKIDQARHTLSPVRIMSMLSYAMYIDAEIPFSSRLFVQNRSMAKTTCTDVRLKKWGLYSSDSGRHARDATRHAFYFLRTCRGNSVKAQENRWRAWPDFFKDPQRRREPEDSMERKPRKVKTKTRVYFA